MYLNGFKFLFTQAVEMNSRRLFSESNIGGHSYLSNMVHLPFFLQNSGLRKVKVAQQTAQAHRKSNASTWPEPDDNINLGTTLARSVSLKHYEYNKNFVAIICYTKKISTLNTPLDKNKSNT